QDILFTTRTVSPAPGPLNDRYEPNDTAAAATNLGVISAQRVVPRLNLPAGDQDWYHLTAGALGNLVVTAAAASNGASLRLEIWNAAGTQMLASSTDVVVGGAVTGQQLVLPSASGQDYLLHVSGGAVDVSYSLALGSLTADLG